MSATGDAYDWVLYPSGPQPKAAPDRLATAGKLFGLTTAPVDDCRYLEIGCGEGGHLIPCACSLPGSRFVGVDRAAVSVDRGRETAASLELNNLDLQSVDLMEMPLEGEKFDYIVAHGLYSWVPEPVRDRCLQICKARLAPHGVAYVSYNTYPGCFARRTIWEILRFHTRALDDPQEKIQQAFAMAKLLSDSLIRGEATADFPWKTLEDVLQRQHPAVLYHDDLCDTNEPCYFHQFMERAARHGLQFLAETDLSDMQISAVPKATQPMLRELEKHDVVLKEQYLDFFTFRRFRRTLLVHSDRAVHRQVDASAARSFCFQSTLRPVSQDPDLGAGAVEAFRSSGDRQIQIDHPLTKAALCTLSDLWPQTISFAELVEAAESRLRQAGHAEPSDVDEQRRDEQIFSEVLVAAHNASALQWRTHADRWTAAIPPRPRLRAYNRLELDRAGMMLTTRDITIIPIPNQFNRFVLLLADGSRDPGQIAQDMAEAVESGKVAVPERVEAGEDHSDAAARRVSPEEISEAVTSCLKTANRFGLFD